MNFFNMGAPVDTRDFLAIAPTQHTMLVDCTGLSPGGEPTDVRLGITHSVFIFAL